MTNAALKKEDDFVSIDPHAVIKASELDKIRVQGNTCLNAA